MAFQTIGFHAALVLNRLRNQRQIKEHDAEHEQRRQEQDRREQEARAKLEAMNKRLALLRARVGENQLNDV